MNCGSENEDSGFLMANMVVHHIVKTQILNERNTNGRWQEGEERGGTCQDFTGVGFCPAPTTTLFLVNIIIVNGINIIETIIFNINNNKIISI